MPRPTPLVIAHRGASGYRPEHSEAAYELAIDLGADAVEPDIVPTRDGVLVLRHENELSTTTDVASRAGFADRRTTKRIDGESVSGWFTEDFTWAELSGLRVKERIPRIRPRNAEYDGRWRMLRLADLLDLLDRRRESQPDRPVMLVAELKHAAYFESIGLPLDELFAAEIAGRVAADELVVEAFEQTVLEQAAARGVVGRRVFLAEAEGAPADLVARHGSAARSFDDHLSAEGFELLAASVHGVSVDKSRLLTTAVAGEPRPDPTIVDTAHRLGLDVYCWTLRAENAFLPKALRSSGDPAEFGDHRTEFELIYSTGLDGVFADQPDLAIAVRDSR